LDQIDPISITQKLKNSLRTQLEESRLPGVMDKQLYELYQKLSLALWIKVLL
jgi:hypothetical protein